VGQPVIAIGLFSDLSFAANNFNVASLFIKFNFAFLERSEVLADLKICNV
jgi:hypothetical protein